MQVLRKYPKSALLVGLALLSAAALVEIVFFELPRSTPGSWPIPLARVHEEFQVEATLAPGAEYTLTARGTMKDPKMDRLYGLLTLAVEEPGVATPRVLPSGINGLNTFVAGQAVGLRRFRGRIERWSTFQPEPGDLESIELVLSGGPTPVTAWIAIGVLVLCFISTTALAVYAIGATLAGLIRKGRPA